MQLLMRRPEIRGFIAVAPPANLYDFSFLAPCPSSGIVVHGTKDEIVPASSSQKLSDKLQAQRAITIDFEAIPGANHFFEGYLDKMSGKVDDYLEKRLTSGE